MDKVKYNSYAEILSDDFERGEQYLEETLGSVLEDFLANGPVTVGLEVNPQAVEDMTVYVNAGRLYQDGRQGVLEAKSNALTITAAHSQYNRIDRICAKYHAVEDMPEVRNVMVDVTTRQVERQSVNTRVHGTVAFQVVPGVASANPVPQAVPDGWVSLGQVLVRANATAIMAGDVTDERPAVRQLAEHTHKGGVDGAQVDYNNLLHKPNASAILSTPTGGISATNVQTAIEELDAEKAPKESPVFMGNVGIGTSMSDCPLEVHRENGGEIFKTNDIRNEDGGWVSSHTMALNNAEYMRMGIHGTRSNGVDTFGRFWVSVNKNSTTPWNDGTFTINNGGNVGIGTTSPDSTYRAHVYEAAQNGLKIQAGDAESDVILSLGSASTPDKVVVRASGKVGINATNPVNTLQVGSATGYSGCDFVAGNTNGGFGVNTTATTTDLYSSNAMRFMTNVAGGATEKMRITTDGNVGIGTTNPSTKLDVAGNTKITGGTTSDWLVSITNNLTNGNSVYFGYVNTTSGQTQGLAIQGGGGTASDVDLSVTDKFYVMGNGNVGIGTSTPASAFEVCRAGTNLATFRNNQVLSSDTSGACSISLGYYSHYAKILETSKLTANTSKTNIYTEHGYNTSALALSCYNGAVAVGQTVSGSWRLDVASGWVNSVSGYKTNGADYGEYYISESGEAISLGVTVIPTGQIDKGTAVVRPATPEDDPAKIIGAVSATCSWIGNNGGGEWPHKYLRNDLGEIIEEEYQEEIMQVKKETVTKERQKVVKVMQPTEKPVVAFVDGKYVQTVVAEMVEVEEPVFEEYDLYGENGEVIGKHQVPAMEEYTEEVEVKNEDGSPVMVGIGEFETKKRPKLNPDYDPKCEYILRENRPEWNVVGFKGQVRILKGQPINPNWQKLGDISEQVELWQVG